MHFTSISTLLFAVSLLGGIHADTHIARSNSKHARRNNDFSYGPSRLRGRSEYTWFVTGLGACGGTNVPSDFVVALSAQSWDGGSHCNEMITINVNGKTAQAQIVDMCMRCAPDDLDFTEGLFSYFESDLGKGTLHGDWSYGSGPQQPTPEPQPTSTYHAPSTSSAPPSSIYTPPPASSSQVASSSAPASSSSASVSEPASTSTTAVPSVQFGANQVAAKLNQVIIQFSNVALAGLAVRV